MLLALYAAQKTAPTEEDERQVAEVIRRAEELEEKTMASLGEASQHNELRALVDEIEDLSALKRALEEAHRKHVKPPIRRRRKR